MQPTSGRTDRTLLIVISLIAVVAVLAVVVVFTRGAPAQLDPSTPEGVVQSYTNAVIDDNRPVATALLAQHIRENCDRAEPGMLTDIRVTVVSTKVTGETAVVRVLISHGSTGGAFGGSGYESDDSFSLAMEDGAWRIDSAPWEFTVCYNQGIDK